ncbi:MAG: hypothetical protein Q4F67_01790 [Propionibacteriaceae bacterium]|nr:hypothetical protein [Propionibacteriaceae bacterium]
MSDKTGNDGKPVSHWETDEDDNNMQGLVTLGVMAAAAIAFLAICVPLFIL